MTRLLLSASFLLLVLFSLAQDEEYVPFDFGQEPTWHQARLVVGLGFDEWLDESLSIVGDTVINDLDYFILEHCELCQTEESPYPYLAGFIRETSDKRVYYLPGNLDNWNCVFENQEYLLYDFGVEVGDEVMPFFPGDWEVTPLQVLSTGTISIENETRKTLTLLSDVAGGEITWIEGIGCTEGLLYPRGSLDNDDCWDFGWGYLGSNLSCYETSSILFTNPFLTDGIESVNSDCTVNPTNVGELKNASITVSPNPASDLLTINMGNTSLRSSWTITILNSAGMIVHEAPSISEGLDISDWSAGLYTAIMRQNGQHSSAVRFIKA